MFFHFYSIPAASQRSSNEGVDLNEEQFEVLRKSVYMALVNNEVAVDKLLEDIEKNLGTVSSATLLLPFIKGVRGTSWQHLKLPQITKILNEIDVKIGEIYGYITVVKKDRESYDAFKESLNQLLKAVTDVLKRGGRIRKLDEDGDPLIVYKYKLDAFEWLLWSLYNTNQRAIDVLLKAKQYMLAKVEVLGGLSETETILEKASELRAFNEMLDGLMVYISKKSFIDICKKTGQKIISVENDLIWLTVTRGALSQASDIGWKPYLVNGVLGALGGAFSGPPGIVVGAVMGAGGTAGLVSGIGAAVDYRADKEFYWIAVLSLILKTQLVAISCVADWCHNAYEKIKIATEIVEAGTQAKALLLTTLQGQLEQQNTKQADLERKFKESKDRETGFIRDLAEALRVQDEQKARGDDFEKKLNEEKTRTGCLEREIAQVKKDNERKLSEVRAEIEEKVEAASQKAKQDFMHWLESSLSGPSRGRGDQRHLSLTGMSYPALTRESWSEGECSFSDDRFSCEYQQPLRGLCQPDYKMRTPYSSSNNSLSFSSTMLDEQSPSSSSSSSSSSVSSSMVPMSLAQQKSWPKKEIVMSRKEKNKAKKARKKAKKKAKKQPLVVSSEDGLHYTLLQRACDEGNIDLVRLLCKEHNADVNMAAPDGETALHIAARKGLVDIAALLINHKANKKAVDEDGYTPLHYAAQEGHARLIPLLVTPEIINQKTGILGAESGTTALESALEQGHYLVVLALLTAGASTEGTSLNAKNHYGTTLLHAAARYGDDEGVRLLLEARANILSVDTEKRTPYEVALLYQHEATAALLMAKDEEVSASLLMHADDSCDDERETLQDTSGD